jgi:p-aminobenzoyl-glutamate transporter AbgT
MTNLVLNAYSAIIEILLWVIVIGNGIAGFVYLMSTDARPVVVVFGAIGGLVLGFLICVLFVAPVILLSNIRQKLVEVRDDTYKISEELNPLRSLKS